MSAGSVHDIVPVVPSVRRIRVQLRPGMAGSPFSQAVAPESGLSAYACNELAELGLAIAPSTGVITGTPRAAGDHDLRVHALRGATPVELDVALIVNADPKSLWRIVEPAADAPYSKPHTATLRIPGDLLVVGASKRGRSHAHAGGFREDHMGARAVGPWRLLAVADGAGSAAMSRLGSQVAVDTALTALESGLNDSAEQEQIASALIDAARAAAYALEDRAALDGIDRRVLSTTLILAAVRRVDAGILTAAWAVGDGGAGLLDAQTGALAILTRPDGGEYAGQTRFLDLGVLDEASNASNTRRVRIDVRPSYSALLLMTDGVTDPRLPTEAEYGRIDSWSALWDEVRGAVDLQAEDAPDQMLGWLDFWSHGNHDDRTLLVLIP